MVNIYFIEQTEGAAEYEFDEEKQKLVFKDGSGQVILVYSRPLVRDSTKQIISS